MQNNPSVDIKEIEKFEKYSNSWWDYEGEYKILHQINPLRIEYITDKIQNHFNKDHKNIHLLDIGCGGGIATCALYKEGYNITGIDASEKNIITAKNHAENSGYKIDYIHTTTTGLLKQNAKYNVILALEVIEHVADIKIFLTELVGLLKEGGMIIISTINRTLKAYFHAILLAEYVLRWVAIGTHNFKKFIQPSLIFSNLREFGLNIKELKGLEFNIPSQKWELSSNIDVNYFAYIAQ